MPKKSILKDLADKMLDNESKQNIKNSYNNLKKEFDGLLNEIDTKKNKEEKNNIEKISNHTTSKNSKNEDIKISKLKENISLIFCFTMFICLMCFSFAMSSFFNDNAMLGVFLILLIPFVIIVTIMLCLKYANLKFKDHLAFLIDKINRKTNNIIKKIKKVITSEVFILTVFVIFSIAFMIFVFVLASNTNQ